MRRGVAVVMAVLAVTSPKQLEDDVTGAGAVRLGMTESEVCETLGKKPSRRGDAMSPGASTDVAWDDLQGPRPGAALGRFRDDRLFSIEFAPASPVLPRLDFDTANSATQADYVRRSVARTLRMADIEAVTRVPGSRASWTIMSGFGSPTRVKSRWLVGGRPGRPGAPRGGARRPRPPAGHPSQASAMTVRYGVWPSKASHETLACQFTNVPVGLSFHAQTWSV